MSYHPPTVNTTIGGTIGGTLLVLFNLHLADITKTAVLAGVGAIVSFMVSFGLTALAKRFRKAREGERNPNPEV